MPTIPVLSAILDLLPDMVYAKDADLVITYANPRYCQLTGRAREEIIGKTAHDLYPRELADSYEAIDARIRDTGEEQTAEVWIEHQPDLERRLVRTTKTPQFDEQGSFSGIVGISHDITERHDLEAEKDQLIADLEGALHRITHLEGLLPICSTCNKIRTGDVGSPDESWTPVADYFHELIHADFTHTYCPACYQKFEKELEEFGR